MTAAEIARLTEDNLNRLVAAMEAGRAEEAKAILKAMGRFHSYSFGNVQLIIWQRPDATRVAGFRTWQKLNRFVKKGEKGIAINVPMVWKPKDQPVGEEKVITRFKAGYVFDLSQTDGEPLPTLKSDAIRGDPKGLLEKLQANVTASGIKLDYVESLGGAEGVSRGGAIALVAGHERPKEFSVLVHEYAHELLHRGEDRSNFTRDQKELEAEAVAYVVSEAIGLDCGNSSSDYIMLYRGDKSALKASFERIQRTSQSILKGLGLEERPEIEEPPRESLRLHVGYSESPDRNIQLPQQRSRT